MKRYIILIYGLLFSVACMFGQSNSNPSYVSTKIYTSKDGSTFVEERKYDNGLGDISQIAKIHFTPSGNNLVSLIEYDQLRRVTKEWLPAVTSNCYFADVNSLKNSAVESNMNDKEPYKLTTYDNPYMMKASTYKSGVEWHSKPAVTTGGLSTILGKNPYIFGHRGDSLLLYSAINNGNGIENVDEDGKVSYIFKNDAGKTVCTCIKDGDKVLATYYEYDLAGNLIRILPPAANQMWDEIKTGTMVAAENTDYEAYKYGTSYKYDHFNHMIYKRLPGREPIYYVYDDAGRCIFTQDGNQRKNGVWAYSIPDIYGRTAITGICHNTMDYTSDPLSGNVVYATLDEDKKYQINGITLTLAKVYITNYYDDYSFIGKNGFSDYMTFMDFPSEMTGECYSAKGSQTGSKIAILEGDYITGYKYSVLYYDEMGRVIESRTNDDFGGESRVFTEYDFQGHPLKSLNVYQRNSGVHEEYMENSYDHAGRLISATHKLDDNSPVILTENKYDEFGRLVTCRKFNDDKLITKYGYNIQSWISSIKTSGVFEEKLFYNENYNGNTPLFSGNITAQYWTTCDKERGYNFFYDNRNQLVKAKYLEDNTNNDHYSTEYEYDIMSNITSLKRRGLQDGGTYGLIDDLECNYNGNQLMSVDDKVTSPTYSNAADFHGTSTNGVGGYAYDANGNLTRDDYKLFASISYNYMNLPSVFNRVQEMTHYTYDATGKKVQVLWRNRYAPSKRYNYCDNYIYEDGVLKQILIPDGYITFSGNQPIYHTFYKDHLGSNRVVVNQRGEVEQINHYYPFGGLMAESTESKEQQFKYNGKEFEPMSGINLYDYGARFYDPVLGRFTAQDPLAEKYGPTSPYVYCVNDPIKHVDPDGREKVDVLPPASQDTRTYALQSDIRHFNDDPNVINIWAHGDSKGISFRGQKDIGDAQSFSDALKSVSKIWKNHKEGEAATIVLHSCMTSSFAKKLSEDPIFKNVLIIAPNRNVQVRNSVGKPIRRINNHQTLNKATYKETGVSNDGYTTGSWIGYRNNNVYNTYDGSFKGTGELKPGTKGFDYRTLMDVIKSYF